MKAPFPYFGGKSEIADIVWKYLGYVYTYIEPFFGSGAVLLARKDYDPEIHKEIICEKDGLVTNVWRSIQFNSDEVKKWCDWPVNHIDLIARKKELLRKEEELTKELIDNPEFYDPKMAGYWIWSQSCSIGNGFISENSIPDLGWKGMGVVRSTIDLDQVFKELQNRLKKVRVVCGDWSRICGGNWHNNLGVYGMFFDPPYSTLDRSTVTYRYDSTSISVKLEDYVLNKGNSKDSRIIVCGYKGEYKKLIENGWRVHNWKTQGGYARIAKESSRGKDNRYKECLFISPYCLNFNNPLSLLGD